MQQGKCSNFGNCDKADSREIITIPDGQEMVCPVCKQRLTPVEAASGGGGGLAPVIVGILLLLLLVGGGFMLVRALTGKKSAAPPPDFAQNSAPPPTNTPPPTAPVTATGAGDMLMYYERSDEKWITQAADDFNKSHAGSRVVLDYRGSREGFRDILDGKGQPVIWNPADIYWVNKLSDDWKAGNHPGDIVDKSAVILKTKLVLVMPADHAKVFQAAMNSPKYRGKTWGLLYEVATAGWSAIQGNPAWGKLKLAQSDPVKSNSGMTAISLMLYEYQQAHPGATTDNSGFIRFMNGIEGAAGGSFFETTSKTIEALQKNKDQYDVAIAYEQNAVNAVKAGATDLQVVYPDPTVDVNFPAATLKGNWVTSERSQIAGQFVDYLLSRDVQKASIDFGFRPAQEMRTEVDAAMGAKNLSDAGLQSDPRTVNTGFNTKTLNDLVFQWNRNVNHR